MSEVHQNIKENKQKYVYLAHASLLGGLQSVWVIGNAKDSHHCICLFVVTNSTFFTLDIIWKIVIILLCDQFLECKYTFQAQISIQFGRFVKKFEFFFSDI